MVSKDVYLEKPVSHNVSEGRRVVEAARKYTRICQTGSQCRSNPGMRQAMEYLAAGHLGQIRQARGLCYRPRKAIGPSGDYPVPHNVNFDLWLGPAPKSCLTRPIHATAQTIWTIRTTMDFRIQMTLVQSLRTVTLMD